jgi:hypothetical protein
MAIANRLMTPTQSMTIPRAASRAFDDEGGSREYQSDPVARILMYRFSARSSCSSSPSSPRWSLGS